MGVFNRIYPWLHNSPITPTAMKYLLTIFILLTACANFHPEIEPPQVLLFTADRVSGGIKLRAVVNESTTLASIQVSKLENGKFNKKNAQKGFFERKPGEPRALVFIITATQGVYEIIVTAINDRGTVVNTYHLNFNPENVRNSLKT